MNVYKVTLQCDAHYGNGHIVRELESQKVTAKNGEDAVKKAKTKVAHSKPTLEGLELLMSGIN